MTPRSKTDGAKGSTSSAFPEKPCSLCGRRDYNLGCERCKERADAAAGGEHEAILFEKNERLRRIQDRHADGLPVERAPLMVGLVGCSSQKKRHGGNLPASELYIGRLAQMGYQYSIKRGWDTHFLSALHGVVPPHHTLAPYDCSMAQLLPSEQMEWGTQVVSDLLSFYPLMPLTLIFLAGMSYIRPVLAALHPQVGYWTYKMPLDGLDLFGRMRWFKAHLIDDERGLPEA